MKFKYPLPKKIEEFIKNSELTEVSIGCSDSQVIKIEKENTSYFLKIMRSNGLVQEYNKLKWLDRKLTVPNVVLFLQEFNNDYLITKTIQGKMLCDDYYLDNPDIAIEVLSKAFSRIFAVDIKDCPFDVSNDYKLDLIKNNVNKNLVFTEDLKEETRERFKTVEGVLKYLEENRFEEELVFSHGDTSLPNIFGIGDTFSGFIDIGECGIADKWFDLAICEKSIRRNYGQEYVDKFYDSLGIQQDRNKIDYYLYMMELYL